MTPSKLANSRPRVRVSRSALADNIARARQSEPSSAVDLRRDACGHGAAIVAAAAREAGVTTAIVDAGEPPHGLDAVTGRALSLEAVFGIDGEGVPAMTFAAPVLQTKPLLAGDGVSYGYLHRAEKATRVALVAGGYAQGVARAIGSRASVVIAGSERPIIGRVAMDVCVVDVGNAPVSPGDEAVYFGSAAPQSLARWAEASGWTMLELVAIVGLGAEREETP
ncbi:hypothetical protein GCM10010915_17960 [Microbacterium faecale]|uniref:Alanine racemase C-terminal domain-containing protein n=1 Tax=Microbacterium faecale TaxID=1804630 RepID=A0A916YAM1_9MICO|nr:alanine racemase C-terminal domain-containing protein [Microbacterium faecale]GGD37555.1 hypothetical protein GCM10010915_17960 [Microbacterium faecale]